MKNTVIFSFYACADRVNFCTYIYSMCRKQPYKNHYCYNIDLCVINTLMSKEAIANYHSTWESLTQATQHLTKHTTYHKSYNSEYINSTVHSKPLGISKTFLSVSNS